VTRLTWSQFRRSIKSDGSNKHDSAKPVQISIPQKDAIAIEPPKKVQSHDEHAITCARA